jgi:hypothetical protein
MRAIRALLLGDARTAAYRRSASGTNLRFSGPT